jgi:hypothetical protein
MLSVARTATENVRVLNFLENDEIVFHLAAMSQCEQGLRVIDGTQLMRIR